MDYYNEEIIIPKVDENDKIIGSIERWRAHRSGILHSGFTACVYFQDRILCQHRKHPLFDNVLDLTASSHPIVQSNVVIPSEKIIYQTLLREWDIKKENLLNKPRSLGKVLYKSADGDYIEHEVCEFFALDIDYLPDHNSEYAYGQLLLHEDELDQQDNLAPWVRAALDAGLLANNRICLSKTGM